MENTLEIARRCAFDPSRHLDYRFLDCPVPEGHTPDSYLEELCRQAAVRRYGEMTPRVRERLEEELRLIRKHGLSGFFLIYHEILKLGQGGGRGAGPLPSRHPPGTAAPLADGVSAIGSSNYYHAGKVCHV